jgi:NTE family protein
VIVRDRPDRKLHAASRGHRGPSGVGGNQQAWQDVERIGYRRPGLGTVDLAGRLLQPPGAHCNLKVGYRVMRFRSQERSCLRRPSFPIVAALLAATAFGCAGVRIENQPLEQFEAGAGYGADFVDTPYSEKLRLVLAFSGGGTRASALAFGVLKELRDTEVVLSGKRVRLLDTVSTISSVSGGSFTSAYYGLYGERIFEDFEERFLRKNINARLGLNLFRPIQILRMWLTKYTRSDMASDIYDKEVFDGATFSDLAKKSGPLLNINATDIDIGAVFTFMQPDFDLICSDLSQLRLAKAVTASSAVPGAFAPLVLKNHAGSCGHTEPAWIQEALADPTKSRRRYHEARAAATYLDPEARPYIFLVDGGVADNIGARRILANVIESGGIVDMADAADASIPEYIVYIVVNAQAGGHHDWEKKLAVPSITSVLSSISSVGIYRYNFETIELLREEAVQWSAQAAKHGKTLHPYVAEVAFDDLDDAEERAFFNGVKTSFDLDDQTVDRLIEVGGRLLRESPDFKKFLAAVK